MDRNNLIQSLKLKSADLANIAEKLQALTTADPMTPSLAYEGVSENASLSCSCKGCEGCTSW